MKKPRVILIASISILIVIRLALPFLIQKYVNRTLNQLHEYRGHIGEVNLDLYRGAYQIENIEINKIKGNLPVPFFKAGQMDLSVEWKQLLNRAFVGEIVFSKPELFFVMAPTKDQAQMGENQNWVKVVRDLFPIKINRLEVKNGTLHYLDYHGEPEVDVYLSSTNAVAVNLTNSERVSKSLTATLVGKALCMGDGELSFSTDFDPYKKKPTFDLDLELKNLSVPKLNNFLRHYADIDVEAGSLSLYMGMTAKDGNMEGYAKPFLKDMKIMDLKKEKLTFTQKIKEGAATLVVKIFKNEEEKTTATRIPFSQKLDETHVGIFSAIGSSFHHILIKALRAELEKSIHHKNS